MIELKQLVKSYTTKHSRQFALQDISFCAEHGEMMGIIGKSGAGKSTLLHCINLLERPDSGQIVVNGQDLLSLDKAALRMARSKIGMIFQQFNLLSRRSVYENIQLPLEFTNNLNDESRKRIDELLDFVGMNDHKDAFPHQLSGGQRQRVAIARALINQPHVLLCDEATSALDPETTQSILQLLTQINREFKVTMLLITHEMDVIKRACHRVVVLHEGKIVEIADQIDFFIQPQHRVSQDLLKGNTLRELPDHIDTIVKYCPHPPGSAVYRFSFRGASSTRPIITQLIQQFGITINILQANLESTQERTLGIMLVELSGEQRDAALKHLDNLGVKIDYLGHLNND